MSSHFDDGVYVPLPPELPPKHKHPKERDDDPIDYVVEERSPRRHPHRVKVIHDPVLDEDHHPRVEESSSPPGRKRDSGKYYGTTVGAGSNRFEDAGGGINSGARVEYERRRPDPEVVQRLVDDLAKERRDRRDAEDRANRFKADLEHEKRRRSLERRERALNDREKRLNAERDHLVEVRRPGERQDVVVHNPPPAPRPSPLSALDRARDDFWRNRRDEPIREAERRPPTAMPGAGDRRSRRHSIVIVEDERGHHGRR